ncbi:MAG: glutamate--cysteine ligase [Synechococcales cyanobacterium RM1_1_8]|nr:glutamate--cysteine ligase [Synechococcales cyanobacterium RM1_1_8]
MTFQFGLEHEVAFLNQAGDFADFSNTTFADWDQIIQKLPSCVSDRASLRVGDLGIRSKRWYVEGFERFSSEGEFLGCVPKGIEIRTTLQGTIAGAITELKTSFNQLCAVAKGYGFEPVLTSFNPQHHQYQPQPPLNPHELNRLSQSPEEQTELLAMVTYGPDLNLSRPGMSTAELIDMGQKLTYYSPFLVPFSFSAPLVQGELWPGLSMRTYVRTGRRPAVLVFVDPASLPTVLSTVPAFVSSPQQPSLIKPARTASEIGRIEFKAFDSCGEFGLYGVLLLLLKGLILDQTLPGRAWVPDRQLHQHSAKVGFGDPEIAAMADRVLEAIAAVVEPAGRKVVRQLQSLRCSGRCAALDIKQAIGTGQDWRQVLKQQYR